MAKAPRPGASARAEKVTEGQKVWTMTLRGETLSCAFNNLPFEERALVRKSTGGLPISAYTGSMRIDEDSYQLLWWVARRMNGEKTLSLQNVLDEWPDDLTGDDVSVELDDGLPDIEDADPQP